MPVTRSRSPATDFSPVFHRILAAAIVAGVVAGIVLTGLQSGVVTPLILAAESYEAAPGEPEPRAHAHDGATHVHAFAAPGHTHEHHALVPPAGAGERDSRAGHGSRPHSHAPAWMGGEDGLGRFAWTVVSNVATAIGFALMLVAVFTWRSRRVSWQHGLLWGAAGFIVFFANPALGLPPGLPGMVAPELHERQYWWLLTVACSGVGVGLLLLAPSWVAKIGGALLLVVPHLVGAPSPPGDAAAGTLPHALADDFLVASALANAAFWAVLGLAAAFAFRRFVRD